MTIEVTDYRPVDVTPPELRAEGIAASLAEGWVRDTTLDPATIANWPARQAAAIAPFEVVDGRPVNPVERTGRVGRDLPRWGENQAADPIVVAGTGPDRRVLLILRSDCRQWAIPGGKVDPGETAPAALVRELREETGVDLRQVVPEILTRAYVADPRNTDEAWITTTAALFRLPAEVPAVGDDDALEARWWPFGDVDQLDQAVTAAGGTLYEAHRPLLVAAVKHLNA
ncbi:NUDIX domain-containing protein [Micromonospora sp. NPDC020750]|uniref:NUDIX domain-containing protein n=1 Tax=unclassified Micromonospora TaxID=2617518 RepID=UPI0037A4CE52